jgi:hypothetical protein
MNAATQLIRRAEELAAGTPIGPRYEYVNPQGVMFHARSGDVVAILKLAERLES